MGLKLSRHPVMLIAWHVFIEAGSGTTPGTRGRHQVLDYRWWQYPAVVQSAQEDVTGVCFDVGYDVGIVSRSVVVCLYVEAVD